ncbi:plasma membrane calcium [Tilletia horrida]|uniref:Calcium-transporting ATPase n=1 Tax=Tilletia horrida TaxID=155126 RepID=A0AAN6JHQ2_9BASI|nr:plasma membrane calcium [Tilletia horrida]
MAADSNSNSKTTRPALPTIITTEEQQQEQQQQQQHGNLTPSVSGNALAESHGSPAGSLTTAPSVPNIAISPTGPNATTNAQSSHASHGRNYSISSLGHNRNPSLGSAAAHLQVPQSPSQGTVSLGAPGSTSGNGPAASGIPHTHVPPSPTLSVISDDQAPTASTARSHNRLPSVSSSAGFSSEPGHGPGMGSADRGNTSKISSGNTATGARPHHHDDDDDDDDDADEKDHPAKGIKGIKQRLRAHTRAGRRAAQEARLEEERKRAREVDPTPFRHRPYEFGDLIDPKSPKLLTEMGGINGLVARLGSDPHSGLNIAPTASAAAATEQPGDAEKTQRVSEKNNDVENVPVQEHQDYVSASQEDRERVYGRNALPERKSKSLLLLMWLAFQDKILILLTVAAIVSLALGLYTDFGGEEKYVSCDNPPPGLPGCPAPKVDWVEGVAIVVAILIVDLVGSLNDYQKERQFAKLNAKKDERNVKVIRQGKQALMSVHDVLVGDVLMLEPGEIIPCDGVFLRGHNVKCDESGATGESDMIRKVPYEECVQAWEQAEQEGGKHPSKDCFLISGSRVLEGYGEYIVIAVGPNSFNGKLMLSLRTDAESTPLQAKLNNLAGLIAMLGAAAGALLFLALMIRFFVQLSTKPGRSSDEKAQSFIKILVISVTVIVVAVPEGLPLAITLALAFATKRMTKMNLLVRLLGSCETMANATVVCTDKTGTLTQNEMLVVAGAIGVDLQFADILDENRGRVNEGDLVIDQKDINNYVQGPLQTLLNDSIAINSTAFEEEAKKDTEDTASIIDKIPGPLAKLFRRKKSSTAAAEKVVGFVGSKTETALLNLAKTLQWEHYKTSRERAEIVQMIPFSSERKAMGVVVKLREGGYRLFLKGASEVLTKACSSHVAVAHQGGEASTGPVQTKPFDADAAAKTEATINLLANQSLRTIAICYRDFAQWPPAGASMVQDAASPEVDYAFLSKDLTLIAITGIEDPLRPGVRDAVEACRLAGVQVKMCTGDNVLTAKSIAKQCGILSEGGIVMEGPVFRKLSDAEMTEVAPKLQVLARSSPEDKKILVEKLKSLGEVVGVTGDGTNDGPALKTANVGFSMGIAGTEVAKEASDIILMDDNFASIVSAIMWGRCVNDAVRKFLQFQLSVNVVAVIVTFVTAVASEEEQSILTAVQLLWLNIIMDTFAALALATDPATPKLLKRKPDRRNAPLISTDMWKMIIGQSIYQIIVVLVLNFRGRQLLGLTGGDPSQERQDNVYMSALIFNVFVWCQLFNQLNCRRLDRKFNIFEDLHRNVWFLLIVAIECGAQVLIIFVGGAAFSATPLDGRGWGISLIAGLVSWPLAILIRLCPTEPIEKILIKIRLMNDPNALPTISPEAAEEALKDPDSEAAKALQLANNRLVAYSRIRGGRVRAHTLSLTTRSKKKDPDATPQSIMALVPALIASAVSMAGSQEPPNEQGHKSPGATTPMQTQ